MKTLRHLFVLGSALGSGLVMANVAAAGELPTLAQPEWLFMGGVEVGGQVFVQKPGAPRQSQQATTDGNGNLITASPGNSAAKFNEYGRQTDPLFFRSLDVQWKRKDGGLNISVLGANIGEDNQKLQLGIEQPGQHYLTLDWDKTDHLRSNTAQSIFGGVGSTNLTVAPGVVQSLYNALFPLGAIATGAGVSQATVTNQLLPTQAGNATIVSNGLPVNLTANPVKYSFAGVPYGCFLSSQAGNVAICHGQTPVQTTILNNENVINLGIQRDRKEIGYRWTPNDHWDVKVNYSNEHRFGVQEQGFLFSSSTSTPLAQVPMPIDDTTQDASITAEYFGTSPWGMKWNGILKYDASIYTDAFSAFDVQNPFGGPGNTSGAGTNCPIASTTAGLNCFGQGQMSTTPNNAANTVMAQVGVDLPGFKSNRYMGTLQFSSMTQNQAFIPMTINPGYTTGVGGVPILTPGLYSLKTNTNAALAPNPASSLNGVVDTFLFNNVLSTQLTSDLKNKASYRYYSNQNRTPTLTFQSWIVNDAAIASGSANSIGSGAYGVHTALLQSYTKQNASDEITWRPASWASIGVFGGWEQYNYSEYAAKRTDEYTGKVFGSLQPSDWATIRFNNSVSSRRYDNYNWLTNVGNQGLASSTENPYLVDYNIANRDRLKGNLYVDLKTPVSGLTLTPTAGYRWDEFPTDQNLITQATAQMGGAQTGFTQLGLRRDQNFNLGIEADYAVNSNVSLTLGYTYERSHQLMFGTSSATTDQVIYNGTMDEYVHTIMAGANFQIIPDRLSLKLSATREFGNDSWGTTPGPNCIAVNAGSGASCGVVSAGNPANPPQNTTFDHFDAKLLYKLDPLAFGQTKTSEAIFQLHYMYERNSVTNWQNDGVAPYMYSTTNSSTTAMRDMIFMAGDNPNYSAQALMASLIFKW